MHPAQQEVPQRVVESVFLTIAGMLDSKQRTAAGNSFHEILPIIDDEEKLASFQNKNILLQLGLVKSEGDQITINEPACRVFKACFKLEKARLVLNDPRKQKIL